MQFTDCAGASREQGLEFSMNTCTPCNQSPASISSISDATDSRPIVQIPVAKYRDQTDWLFRVANNDFCACVHRSELESWIGRVERVREEVLASECKRAKPYDIKWRLSALAKATENIDKARAELAEPVFARSAKRAKNPYK